LLLNNLEPLLNQTWPSLTTSAFTPTTQIPAFVLGLLAAVALVAAASSWQSDENLWVGRVGLLFVFALALATVLWLHPELIAANGKRGRAAHAVSDLYLVILPLVAALIFLWRLWRASPDQTRRLCWLACGLLAYATHWVWLTAIDMRPTPRLDLQLDVAAIALGALYIVAAVAVFVLRHHRHGFLPIALPLLALCLGMSTGYGLLKIHEWGAVWQAPTRLALAACVFIASRPNPLHAELASRPAPGAA
jgi:hypothetical protein